MIRSTSCVASLRIINIIGGTFETLFGLGTNLRSTPRRGRGGGGPGWNWYVKNTTTGSTGQVQINGGDGFAATLNGKVCNVGGNPTDTLISGAFPQLAVTGNGVIYGYAVPPRPAPLRR